MKKQKPPEIPKAFNYNCKFIETLCVLFFHELKFMSLEVFGINF